MTHDLQRALTPSELGAKRRRGARVITALYEFHLVAQKLQTFCSEDLGGVLPRHPEGPALYRAGRLARAALGAERAVSHHAEPHAAPRADPVVHRAGGVGDAERHARRACSSRRGTTSSCPPTPTRCASAGSACARCARTCRSSSRRCASRAASARRSPGEVELYANGEEAQFLRSFDDDLRFVFITSQARVAHDARAGCGRYRAARREARGAPEPASEVRALLALPRGRRRRRRAPGDLRALRRQSLRRRGAAHPCLSGSASRR